MLSWLPGLLVVLSFWTASERAPRQRRDAIEVRWEAPAECPDEGSVRAGIERHVGRRLADIRDRRMSIIATAHPDGSLWSLTIFTVTPEGTQERSLQYTHGCTLLAEAAAVLIAMTIDPQVLARLDPTALELLAGTAETAPPAPEPSPQPAPEPEPVDPTPPIEPAPPASEPAIPTVPRPSPRTSPLPRRALDARGAARLSGSLGFGDIPSVGGGVGGALVLRLGRFQTEVTAGGWFLRSVKLAPLNAAGAIFNLWTLGLRGGAALRAGRRFEVPLMLGVEAGQVRVHGVELVNSKDARTPWFAVTVTTGLAYVPRPFLALILNIDGLIPATRPSFVVAGVGEIFRPQPVGVRAALGIEWRFSGSRGRKSR